MLTATPCVMPNSNGMSHRCDGLSSALTKPTERVTTGAVRQRMKRMLNMIEVVVIMIVLRHCERSEAIQTNSL